MGLRLHFVPLLLIFVLKRTEMIGAGLLGSVGNTVGGLVGGNNDDIPPGEKFIYKRFPPCFDDVEDVPQCDSSLPESFDSDFVPLGPNKPYTKFYLFTPRYPKVAEPLHDCGGELPPESNYNIDNRTEIIIHGYMDGVCRTAWMRQMRNELFERGGFNVILVDWTWGNGPNLTVAEANSRIVGQQMGFVINNIIRQTGSSPDDFHIIGHSLGAIAAGFAGRMVNREIRRITGLDPSFAEISQGPPDQRLTYRDAKIVDIIHSNSYHNRTIGIGDERQLGDADFYPNGGLIQCSCYPYVLTNATLIDDFNYVEASLRDPRLCFHLQSLQYYKVSINPSRCEFIGLACESYEKFLEGKCEGNPIAVMGMDYELYRNGDERRKYYLNTCLTSPYYDNPESLNERNDIPFENTCTDCQEKLPNSLIRNVSVNATVSACKEAYENYVQALIKLMKIT